MKTLKPNFGLAALMLLGTFGIANAQSSVYQNPEECVAQVGTLDVNGDGFVDEPEVSSRITIETNVDTDGDGKISQEEMIVACDTDLLDALKPTD